MHVGLGLFFLLLDDVDSVHAGKVDVSYMMRSDNCTSHPSNVHMILVMREGLG